MRKTSELKHLELLLDHGRSMTSDITDIITTKSSNNLKRHSVDVRSMMGLKHQAIAAISSPNSVDGE